MKISQVHMGGRDRACERENMLNGTLKRNFFTLIPRTNSGILYMYRYKSIKIISYLCLRKLSY